MSKDGHLNRYDRQIRFAPLGEAGQRRLAGSRVLLVGCGALGSASAELLVRGGIGQLRIVDRDYVEISNLQRQSLFSEEDATSALPKAVAAAQRLRAVNSQVSIEPIVADVTFENVRRLAEGVDLILDGTDNFETRLLLNDLSIESRIPWIFGGVVGAEGQVLVILPGETPCLLSLVTASPPPGSAPTCDTAGVIGPAVHVVSAVQIAEALKILSGAIDAVRRELLVVDLWTNRMRSLKLEELHPLGECPACHRQEFRWLRGERGSQASVLCGRNAVQIASERHGPVDLEQLAQQFGASVVMRNQFLISFAFENAEITLFRDGRAIVSGVTDPALARSLVARSIGS